MNPQNKAPRRTKADRRQGTKRRAAKPLTPDTAELEHLRRGGFMLALQMLRDRTGCSLFDARRALNAVTCGREAETPGYLPCRQAPHPDGFCVHVPNAMTALEILKEDPTGPEAQKIAATFLPGEDIAENERRAREHGRDKYDRPNWIRRSHESASERRERVLAEIDRQRIPDLVAVLRDTMSGRTISPTQTTAEHLEDLARRLLHAARRPPTINELMARARANAGIGGPETIGQIERETQQAAERLTNTKEIPRNVMERAAFRFSAAELRAHAPAPGTAYATAWQDAIEHLEKDTL